MKKLIKRMSHTKPNSSSIQLNLGIDENEIKRENNNDRLSEHGIYP